MQGELLKAHGDVSASPAGGQAAGRPPTKLRRVTHALGRALGGVAITVGGLVAGALTYGLGEHWLDPHDTASLAGAVAVAVWFTAGLGGWLTPRKWPRLLVVFALAGAVGWLFFTTVQRWIP